MHPTRGAPVIAVVIPTFNRSASVLAAVQSVLRQDVSDIEVIVVDDGSTDGTVAILRAHADPRVRVESMPHGGRCNARNRGVELAVAPWVTFLDSDDLVLDGWLAALVAGLSSGALLVSCGARFCYPDGTSREFRPAILGAAFGMVEAQFLAGTFAAPAELFRAVGGYLPGLEYGENTELGMRLGTEVAARGALSVADQRMLVDVQAAHRRYDPELLYHAGVLTLGAAEDLLCKDPAFHASYLAIAGVAASRSGRGPEARQLLRRAWRVQPTNWRHPARLVRTLLPVRGWR